MRTVVALAGCALVGVFALATCGQQAAPSPQETVTDQVGAVPVHQPGQSEIPLPVPDDVARAMMADAVRVGQVMTDHRLSAAEQNQQTAHLSTGALVLDNHPGIAEPGILQPVTVTGFTYLSADMAELQISTADGAMFLTFVPGASGWKVDDVTTTRCRTGSACPFDPPLPTDPPPGADHHE